MVSADEEAGRTMKDLGAISKIKRNASQADQPENSFLLIFEVCVVSALTFILNLFLSLFFNQQKLV